MSGEKPHGGYCNDPTCEYCREVHKADAALTDPYFALENRVATIYADEKKRADERCVSPIHGIEWEKKVVPPIGSVIPPERLGEMKWIEDVPAVNAESFYWSELELIKTSYTPVWTTWWSCLLGFFGFREPDYYSVVNTFRTKGQPDDISQEGDT